MKNWKVNSWRKYPVKHVPTYGDEKELNNVLKELNFKKEKVFRDPRLIMFFSWLKSKYTNKKTYEILLNEYHSLK